MCHRPIVPGSPHGSTQGSSVMETHFCRFYRGDTYDKSARKQSGQPGCESNAHSSWVGDRPLLIKCFQCSSDNRFRTVHVLDAMLVEVPSKKLVAVGPLNSTSNEWSTGCSFWPRPLDSCSGILSFRSAVIQTLRDSFEQAAFNIQTLW